VKVKIYSWILASAYLLCGAALSFALFKIQAILSGFNIELPFMTRMALAVGPVGWLCVSVAAGLFVILKDLRFHSRLLNPLFTLVLVAWMICMAIALVSSLMATTCSITENAGMPSNLTVPLASMVG
jgi:hypothetical protein